MKLANTLKTHQIGGRSFQFGRLTIGIGVEVEEYLQSLPSEIYQVESSGILKSVPGDVASSIVSEMLQRHDVYPPDAITAICQKRNLMNAKFCKVLVRAALRQYNPGLPLDEVESVAEMATQEDATRIAVILIGVDENDPKELPVAEPPPT